MKWVLIILGTMILLNVAIVLLLYRRTREMEKRGFWYNHEEGRWERR